MWADSAYCQSLSRGHAILQAKGLQIQAMSVPDHGDPGINLQRFAQSNFTAVNLNTFDRSVNLSKYLGTAPGVDWGMWLNNGPNALNVQELSYLSKLISLQFHDELNVALPGVLAEAKAVLADWRQQYPHVIGYLNHISSNTDAQLQNYMSVVEPDMLMFATYPFNGSVAGGSPTDLYVDLQRFRKLGLAGHDGSGQQPIPYGLYLQTFTWGPLANHYVSSSEMRLNQFAAWAFGSTYATAFIYLDIPNESDFKPALFNGAGDSSPRQPAFDEMAETNRQSRHLGPAMVQLVSTDVRMIVGDHATASGSVANPRPSGVADWTAGAGNDLFLTGISRQNLGSTNAGLRGDVVVGRFKPLQGPAEPYFMVVNGLSGASAAARDAVQQIRLDFNFQGSDVRSLLRLNRLSGNVEVVSLKHDGGAQYHVDLSLDGGTGDIFKYNDGTPFVGGYRLPGGYAVGGASGLRMMDGDGTSPLGSDSSPIASVIGLANGNVLSRSGVDVWRVHDPQGNLLASRQLDNLGTFNSAAAVGEGGYAAVSDSNIVFMAADGITPVNVVPNSIDFAASLSNGNLVGRVIDSDIWRIYTPQGSVHATRVLDNLGTFTAVAATGDGGYAAATDSRIIFMAADGLTPNNVVVDSVAHLTSLSNGNVVGETDPGVWRLYTSSGQTLATLPLDNLGTFVGAAPLWGGGFLAYTNANAIFVAPDGLTVSAVVPDALEFATGLNNGNVVGRLAGTDLWRLYSPLGDVLATQQLTGIGTVAVVAPLGMHVLPGDFDGSGVVDVADLAIWRRNNGLSAGQSAASGDADADGDVDGADFLAWQRYVSSGPNGGATVVPEPHCCSLVACISIVTYFSRRRTTRSSPPCRRRPIPIRVAAVTVIAGALAARGAAAEPLSRGHEILERHSLQIHAVLVPHAFSGKLDVARFAESGFTGLSLNSFDRTLDLTHRLGLPADVATGLWIYAGAPILNSLEEASLKHLITMQWRDEQDITDPQQLELAREFLDQFRRNHPGVIAYLNQNGIRHTEEELRQYLASVRPDMVTFDIYPFDGHLIGGSPTTFYRALQRYRLLGLAGHDGSGRSPIPYGLYLQTFTSAELHGHQPSLSEMRLNQFAAWAFGYTFASAFIYAQIDDNRDLIPALFDQSGDGLPRQPSFDEIAAINRQSRRLGSALVRLRSTDVGILPGQHRSADGLASEANAIPENVPLWAPHAGEDQYLVGVSAQNLGSKNHRLPGDVVIGRYASRHPHDGTYFMLVNGLTSSEGSAEDTTQRIRLDFDFQSSGIRHLLRLSRDTGAVEALPLMDDGGGRFHLELDLEGGTGDLLKYDNGQPFVGVFDSAPSEAN
jgi:hypothetical protein